MKFFRIFFAVVLIGVCYNMFKSDASGSTDGIQQDFCKDRKCIVCDTYIGCYGYDWSPTAGVVIGSDNSLRKCRKCAENRN